MLLNQYGILELEAELEVDKMTPKHHSPDYFTILSKELMMSPFENMEGPYLAKILKINKVKGEVFADVQPLVKVNKKKSAIVSDCRFIYQPIRYEKIEFTGQYETSGEEETIHVNPGKPKYPSDTFEAKLNYKVGDCVLLVLTKYDDDNFKSKPKEFNTTTRRKFEVGSSYIIGKVATKKDIWKEQ